MDGCRYRDGQMEGEMEGCLIRWVLFYFLSSSAILYKTMNSLPFILLLEVTAGTRTTSIC